jgi:hypothetical protein
MKGYLQKLSGKFITIKRSAGVDKRWLYISSQNRKYRGVKESPFIALQEVQEFIGKVLLSALNRKLRSLEERFALTVQEVQEFREKAFLSSLNKKLREFREEVIRTSHYKRYRRSKERFSFHS